ncbi:MAG: hypothetical protein Q4D77_04720 [Peptostreptococcaceae bacterium]|nr:hypothetical protein [Peptostreptococcaceae bacterium]
MINKRNKILLFLGLILAQVPLLGAAAFHHFTRKKLGMMRHVVYLNGKWEADYPIRILRIVAIALLLIMVVQQIAGLRKRKEQKRVTWIISLLTLCCAGFIFLANTEWSRAYYLMSMCLVLYTIFLNLWLMGYRKKG